MVCSIGCLLILGVGLWATLQVGAEVSSVVVKVKQGDVAGSTITLRNGRMVTKFSQIPYAMPPVGERRFKDPEPIVSWSGIWNSTSDTGELMACLQYVHSVGGAKVNGQEDCLHLTVYTPWIPKSRRSRSKPLDVIVYIHGGAFMFGTGALFEPITLLENHDVVYVSLNYRLGPLGFLSTGDDVVPGNMGLKDQTQALRWVQENIAAFGGSPDSVTISGMSAGGASVHFQMLSSQARGLFHKAISMSGTMLSPWTIAENLPNKSKLIADALGCPVTSSEVMVECLRNRPGALIVNAVRLTQPFLFNPFSPWGPTVDSFAKDPVLPDYPAELIKRGKVADVPWINSIDTAEGLYPGAEFLGSEDILKTIDKDWTSLAPHILDFNFTVPDFLKKDVADKIRARYLGDDPIKRENHKQFIQIISDRMFNVDAERSARFQSEVNKSPVYFYVFNFRGRYSLSNIFTKTLDNFGVSHGDDTNYAIQFMKQVLDNTTDDEQKTIDFMDNLWVSFARRGKPHIPGWTPVTPNSFNYLNIECGDDYSMVYNITEIGSRSFWDSLPMDEKNIWVPSDTKSEQTVAPTHYDLWV